MLRQWFEGIAPLAVQFHTLEQLHSIFTQVKETVRAQLPFVGLADHPFRADVMSQLRADGASRGSPFP